MNEPNAITAAEWSEIAQIEDIQDMWGLDGSETAENLAGMIYGVRFKYQTEGPGYCGPLYLLQGGAGPEWGPVTLIRGESGALEVLERG